MPEESDIQKETMQKIEVEDVMEKGVKDKEEPPPRKTEISQKVQHRNEQTAETSTTNRMLQIEQEKLEVEKQKLQVMKHISRDLFSISKTLVELLRNTRK